MPLLMRGVRPNLPQAITVTLLSMERMTKTRPSGRPGFVFSGQAICFEECDHGYAVDACTVAVVYLVNTGECAMAAIESVWWDLDDEPDGNVQHIADHGLSKEEVEEVLANPSNPTDTSHSSGRPATFGWTSTGKHIIVVWEEVQDDPLTAFPVTAYEVPPPASD